MTLALSLLISLWSALPADARTGASQAAAGDGPPFVLAWRAEPGGAVVLEVVSRWADGGAITLALLDGDRSLSRSTASLAVRARRTFAWNPPRERADGRPLRVTASWRDPAGGAGATATAVWPEPATRSPPRFVPIPPVRIHGLTLDQAIPLP